MSREVPMFRVVPPCYFLLHFLLVIMGLMQHNLSCAQSHLMAVVCPQSVTNEQNLKDLCC